MATNIHCIVKRRGHKEEYDERKVYASVYAACLSAHVHHQNAEKIAAVVCSPITKWVKKKGRVNCDEIFKRVIIGLAKKNKEAAFMYETHRDIS